MKRITADPWKNLCRDNVSMQTYASILWTRGLSRRYHPGSDPWTGVTAMVYRFENIGKRRRANKTKRVNYFICLRRRGHKTIDRTGWARDAVTAKKRVDDFLIQARVRLLTMKDLVRLDVLR